MPNVYDYLERVGGESLTKLPFTPVDSLILSQFAYSDFPAAASPCTLASAGAAVRSRSALDRRLVAMMRESDRFAKLEFAEFTRRTDPDEGKQFAAITAFLPDGTLYAAFRGTDATLVGWKEDFNLAFATPVPAQRDAAAYLDALAAKYHAPLRVGGHSKGGNLAVYAAAACREDTQAQILEVYTNDGPGLDAKTVATDGYARVRERIRAFIPQSSIVGMLLEHAQDYRVVRSNAPGLIQHSAYTWQIKDADFDTLESRTPSSVKLDSAIRTWLEGMSPETRRAFTDALFDILSAGGNGTLLEVLTNWRHASERLTEMKQISKENRALLTELAAKFAACAMLQYKDEIGGRFASLLAPRRPKD